MTPLHSESLRAWPLTLSGDCGHWSQREQQVGGVCSVSVGAESRRQGGLRVILFWGLSFPFFLERFGSISGFTHTVIPHNLWRDTQCLIQLQGKILCPLKNSGEPVKLLSNHPKYDYLNFQEDSLKKRSMQKLWVSCRQSQISQRILMRWSFTWRLLLINLNILMTPGNISSNCS